jgi:hypothetical protein
LGNRFSECPEALDGLSSNFDLSAC